MTTDLLPTQRLLELAASAAGIKLGGETDTGYAIQIDTKPYVATWNPLIDGGDALGLAVKLRLSISIFDNYVIVGYYTDDVDGREHHIVEQVVNIGHDAATRKAIVCAAAQIGEHQNA